MRAVFVREISNGIKTYRLWRGAGKPNVSYPRAENDKYILHVELNGYLVPLRLTDFDLINHCGVKLVEKELNAVLKSAGSISTPCGNPRAMKRSWPLWRQKKPRSNALAEIRPGRQTAFGKF